MTNITYPTIRAKVMRLTRLDSCGLPVAGPKSRLVSNGLIKVDIKAEREDGEDTVVKNGNGDICYADKAQDQLKWLTADIEMCHVDPEATNIMTSDPLALDAAGNSIGYSIGDTIRGWWALELWSDVPGRACLGGAKAYGYTALPFMVDGKLGDLSVGRESNTLMISARSERGTPWDVGPYNVMLDATVNTPVPGKLITPILPGQHLRSQLVQVPPPVVTNGAAVFPVPA